jgi:hypothetical protein
VVVTQEPHTSLSIDGTVVQTYPEIDVGDPVVTAIVQEPYIALHTASGKLRVYHGDASSMELKPLYRAPDGDLVGLLGLSFDGLLADAYQVVG